MSKDKELLQEIRDYLEDELEQAREEVHDDPFLDGHAVGTIDMCETILDMIRKVYVGMIR